jgi:hypothetical protein
MASPRLTLNIELNESQSCKVRGCQQARHKLAGYCQKHAQRNTKWGHPLGRAWSRREIDQYLPAARSFIEENREHRGIAAAIEFLDAELSSAYEKVKHTHMITGFLANSLRHLHDFGVTGEEILVRVVACLLFEDQLAAREADPEVFKRNSGRYVLLAAPRLGPPVRMQKYGRTLGRWLFANLKPLYAHVLSYTRRRERERERRREAFLQPFAGEDGEIEACDE